MSHRGKGLHPGQNLTKWLNAKNINKLQYKLVRIVSLVPLSELGNNRYWKKAALITLA